MKLRTLGTLTIGTMVVACTGQPIRPTASKAPVSVPTTAGCAFDADHRESQNCCVMKVYRMRAAVDIAYAAAVREYDFRSVPREYELEGEAYPERFHGHRHETQAGRSYRLQGIVIPRSDARLARGLWLGLDINQIAPELVEVTPVYCAVGGWPMEKQRLWHDAVQRSIHSTLPPVAD